MANPLADHGHDDGLEDGLDGGRDDGLDEGLRWGDESDPTHVDSRVPEPADVDDAPAIDSGISSPLLVTLGVFGGIFLLYVVGWIIGIQRNSVPPTNPFFNFMYRFNGFLGILSPAAWFFGTLVLTRGRRTGVRLLWLVIGVLVLAPWPFILALGAV